jgi:predicted Zn finger-like uncharacterized protein
MHVQCPICGAGGSLPDHKVPPSGIKITCPKCKAAFTVQKPNAEPNQDQQALLHYNEGVKLLKQRQVDAAIEKFNLAIQANPQYGEAYRYLGLAYGQKNLWSEAIQVLQQALTFKPDDLQSLKNLGVAYLKQNKFSEAEQVLQQALQYAPDDEKVQSYHALAVRKNEEQQAATASQETFSPNDIREESAPTLSSSEKSQQGAAAPRKRDPVRALLDKGVEYLENAQFNNATEAFNEVIRLEPSGSDGYFGLGLVYEQKGEMTKAIDAYKKAVEVNPDDSAAQENLKAAQKQQKKFNWKFWKKG